jgi:adenylate cyclase
MNMPALSGQTPERTPAGKRTAPIKKLSMDSDRLPRKLAATLYADVAGYSRLTGEDEDTTHPCLRIYLDIVAANISAHGGRVMHYPGDAVLARFAAVADAISCAKSVQKELEDRDRHPPCEREVEFRIGVTLNSTSAHD